MHLEADPNEICRLEAVPVYLSQRIHLMSYGWRLKQILQQGWDLVHCWEEPYIVAGGQVAWWTPSGTPLVIGQLKATPSNIHRPLIGSSSMQ
jgi:hypothetical protein